VEMLILCIFSLYYESYKISEKFNWKLQNAFVLFCNWVRPPFALMTLAQLLIYEQNMVIMFFNVIWEWFKGNLVLQLKQKH